MTARSWLNLLRMDCERISFLALLTAEGGEPSHVATTGRSGTSDPTYTRATARMAATAHHAYEMAILERRIGNALRVIASARLALGDAVADTIDLYYCTADRPTWEDVAATLHCSVRLCYIRRDYFCDWLDECGIDAAVRGFA